MKKEIKKIYSLDELNNCKTNTFVKVYNPALGNRNDNLYIGKNKDVEHDSQIYRFLSHNPFTPQDKMIVDYFVHEHNLEFNNGLIKAHAHKHDFLRPGKEKHDKKSKLIWKTIKEGNTK